MCDVCRQTPCSNMCPNAKPRKTVGICSVCHSDSLDGEEIYQVAEDEAIHVDCVKGFTPEEVFTLTNNNPSTSFRLSDIDAEMFLNAFNIYKRRALYYG